MDDTWEELPKKFTPALKKRVSKDYASFFPEFGCVKPLFLRKRIGCFLFSFYVEIIRGSEDYCLNYSVHNLSREVDGLSATLSVTSYKPTNYRLRWHDKNFRDAGRRMREQAILPLEGPLSLVQMIDAYKKYLETPFPSRSSFCVEDPAMICAWAGRDDLAQDCLQWGYDTFKTFPEGMQNQEGGLDLWRARMEKIIADPDTLRRITKEQVSLKKLDKIPYQDFPDATYKEAL